MCGIHTVAQGVLKRQWDLGIVVVWHWKESVMERAGSVEWKSFLGISSVSDLDRSEKQINECLCI